MKSSGPDDTISGARQFDVTQITKSSPPQVLIVIPGENCPHPLEIQKNILVKKLKPKSDNTKHPKYSHISDFD